MAIQAKYQELGATLVLSKPAKLAQLQQKMLLPGRSSATSDDDSGSCQSSFEEERTDKARASSMPTIPAAEAAEAFVAQRHHRHCGGRQPLSPRTSGEGDGDGPGSPTWVEADGSSLCRAVASPRRSQHWSSHSPLPDPRRRSGDQPDSPSGGLRAPTPRRRAATAMSQHDATPMVITLPVASREEAGFHDATKRSGDAAG